MPLLRICIHFLSAKSTSLPILITPAAPGAIPIVLIKSAVPIVKWVPIAKPFLAAAKGPLIVKLGACQLPWMTKRGPKWIPVLFPIISTDAGTVTTQVPPAGGKRINLIIL